MFQTWAKGSSEWDTSSRLFKAASPTWSGNMMTPVSTTPTMPFSLLPKRPSAESLRTHRDTHAGSTLPLAPSMPTKATDPPASPLLTPLGPPTKKSLSTRSSTKSSPADSYSDPHKNEKLTNFPSLPKSTPSSTTQTHTTPYNLRPATRLPSRYSLI